jgi:hypothetical protein
VQNKSGSPQLAQMMYNGVRVGGDAALNTSFRWGYGWPYGRGYRALNADEQQQAAQAMARYRQQAGAMQCPSKPVTLPVLFLQVRKMNMENDERRLRPCLCFDLGGVLIRNAVFTGLPALLPAGQDLSVLRQRWLHSSVIRRFESGLCSADEFAQAFVQEWVCLSAPVSSYRNFIAGRKVSMQVSQKPCMHCVRIISWPA